MLEILRSWCSHALDCVPSLPLITGEQSLFVVGGMPKMFPTVTIMKNLIECALFQGLGDFDNFFFYSSSSSSLSARDCYSASPPAIITYEQQSPNQIPFDINISTICRKGG